MNLRPWSSLIMEVEVVLLFEVGHTLELAWT
jgi:hypothetical protein